MVSRHEYFEQLCTLAAIGEVTTEERTELREHLAVCPGCRREFDEYKTLVGELSPRASAAPNSRSKFLIPFLGEDGVRDRFFTKAYDRGFRFSEDARAGANSRSGWASRRLLFGAMLLMIGASAALGYQWTRAGQPPSQAELISLNQQNTELRRRLAESDGSRNVYAVSADLSSAPTQQAKPAAVWPSSPGAVEESATLDAQLARAREENIVLLARVKAAEEQLQTLGVHNQSLQSAIESAKVSEGDLGSKLNQANATIGQMTEELQQLREGRSTTASLLAEQDSRLKELDDKLKNQSESIDRQKRLLSADRDIRDLMTARNLHIIDVFDVDGKGNTRRTFGRVFYTEAKSLIFYAFDLEDKRVLNADYAFQAWGFQESGGQSRSLGVFYIDDRKQNRWALKFSDPRTLAQIDAVFVTIEPPGGSPKPTGQKLLYAYLRNKPNHP